MTDTKHTPEPWTAIGFGVYTEGDHRCREIIWGRHNTRRGSDEEREANARLIAAAPDMLAALCEVIADIEAYCEDHMSNNPTDVTVGLPRLRAAVYKATEKEAK